MKIINYNKSLQSKMAIDINLYKEVSDKYREFSTNGLFKDYNKITKELTFEGKLQNGKLTGLGKEYKNGKLIFEGEYKNGKKNGLGKIYRDNKIIFEGTFLDGKQWEGNGELIEFEKNGDDLNEYRYIGEISKGKKHGKGKRLNKYGKIEYEGEYIEGKKSGKGKELSNFGELIYEGEYLNDKRNGQGKEYKYGENFLVFEGQFLNGQRWEGIGKEYDTNVYCLSFEGEYKTGKKNGKAKEYYYVYDDSDPNRKIKFKPKIKFEGNYLDGEKEGECMEYHKNGKIKFKGVYSKGLKWDGVGYDENGEIILEMKNGEGKGKIYDEKNNLIFEGEFKNGEYFNGKIYEYEKGDGNNYQIKFEGIYENGQLKKGKKYEKNEIIFEGEYKNNKEWEGKIKNYKIENNFITQGKISEGKWSGFGKEYDQFETVIYEGEFLEGKRHGKGKEFSFSSFEILEFEGTFNKGKKNGLFKVYSQLNGRIIEEKEYKDDVLINGKEFDEYGNIIYEGTYKDDKKFEGIIKEYYPNGNLKKEGEYLNEKYNGKMKEYFSDGNILFSG